MLLVIKLDSGQGRVALSVGPYRIAIGGPRKETVRMTKFFWWYRENYDGDMGKSKNDPTRYFPKFWYFTSWPVFLSYDPRNRGKE